MKAEGGKQKAESRRQKAEGRKRNTIARLYCLLPTAFCFLLFASQSYAADTWTKQRSGSFGWLHAVYFLDEKKGWAVGSKGVLLATDDGGETWQTMQRPTEDALQDIYFSDEQNGWLVCERSVYDLKTNDEPRTYLMRTTDGGKIWTRVNVIGKDVDARLVRALFTREGRGWAFGEGGLLYTTRDGGTNWERQLIPTRHLLLGGWFLNSAQGWLVGAGATILQTTDGGETWRTTVLLNQAGGKDVADAQHVRFNAVSFADRLHGWAVGAQGRVFITNDGGSSWREQQSNVRADLYDVKFVNAVEGWAVGAEGTLIHTMDGGLRWVAVPSGTTHALERLCFVSRTRGWAVGFGGTIIAYAPTVQTPQTPKLKG